MAVRTIPRLVLVVLLLTVVVTPFMLWQYPRFAINSAIGANSSSVRVSAVQHLVVQNATKAGFYTATISHLQASRNPLRRDGADEGSESAIVTGLASAGMKKGITGGTNQRLPLNQVETIAIVCPTFTTAAYHNSFYKFYELYRFVQPPTNITTNLSLLKSRVTSNTTISAFHSMTDLAAKIKTFIPNAKLTILTDQDVDRGAIFNRNGSDAYDIVVLGHQEYVTQREYDNLKQYVTNGGIMILLDGNVFYAEVSYDEPSQTITLVKGHGWAYNGVTAWPSIGERWANETREWVGSNYLCNLCKIGFQKNPFGYRHHEEQYISNPHDIIIFKYPTTDQKHTIATYELQYKKGKVIGLGIYADDVEKNRHFESYFSSLLVHYAMTP